MFPVCSNLNPVFHVSIWIINMSISQTSCFHVHHLHEPPCPARTRGLTRHPAGRRPPSEAGLVVQGVQDQIGLGGCFVGDRSINDPKHGISGTLFTL